MMSCRVLRVQALCAASHRLYSSRRFIAGPSPAAAAAGWVPRGVRWATTGAPEKEQGQKQERILPVTLLSGFLGAGKTTLLKSILRNRQGMKVAVIVNDMGAVNIDAEEIKGTKVVQEKVEMIEFQNGCICCTLRGDLLKSVKELAESDAGFDYLVIESTGVAEPLPVAQTFVMDVNGGGHAHEHGHEHGSERAAFDPLNRYARMDTMVTVLDSFNFRDVLGKVEAELDRRQFIREEEESEEQGGGRAPLANLLVDQIEFANVILLNKTDLLPEGERLEVITQLGALVTRLNPGAKVVVPPPFFEGFDVREVVNTAMFDMEQAERSAGWLRELYSPAHAPETEAYGISSVVFRSGRPFHPPRLHKLLDGWGELLAAEDAAAAKAKNPFAGVVRAKGHLWLANHDGCGVNMHAAGRQLEFHLNYASPWIATIPRERWGAPEEETAAAMRAAGAWDEKHGDRGTQLVCIGVDMDKEAVVAALEGALMTEGEMEGGSPAWRQLDDPFFHTSHFDFSDNRRPFHPLRLYTFLKTFGTRGDATTPEAAKGAAADVVSCRGEVWLACNEKFPQRIQTRYNEFRSALREEDPFFPMNPDEWDDWQKQAHAHHVQAGTWHETYGDRASELQCIGVSADKEAVLAALRDCLLTDEEMAGGADAWKALENPFATAFAQE